MGRFEHLRVRQIDSAVGPFREVLGSSPPEAGWGRTIREGLGMSLRQLASRMGLSKTAVAALEHNEASGSIRMKSLESLADALDCDLVYGLVPRGSLEAVIRNRAREVADRVVGRVSHSMELEEQGIPMSDRDRQVMEFAAELWQKMPRELWDDPL